jgi:flagellar protein FlbD
VDGESGQRLLVGYHSQDGHFSLLHCPSPLDGFLFLFFYSKGAYEMIEVTRFNGTKLILNADMIETIEASPDAVVMLTSGKKWVVTETTDELISKIIEYKRRCYPDVRELYKEE